MRGYLRTIILKFSVNHLFGGLCRWKLAWKLNRKIFSLLVHAFPDTSLHVQLIHGVLFAQFLDSGLLSARRLLWKNYINL